MDERIRMIRDEERKYHEACYDQHKLYEPGSWLHKPVQTVMETLGRFGTEGALHVLDLGCGVGRNSIPIAEALKQRGGTIVCVDLLEAALHKLVKYCDHYGVRDHVQTHCSDIGDYQIAERTFDMIVAVSALEHLESKQKLKEVLERMAHGTKAFGINCIIMGTNIRETLLTGGDALEPMMELNLATDEAEALFSHVYRGWSVCFTVVKALQFHIERNNIPIRMECDCITYVVQRGAGK
jgi:SAM-dependent methyltransferase